MQAKRIDKRYIILGAIALVLIGIGVGVARAVGELSVDFSHTDIEKILFVLESKSKPIATQVLFFYAPDPESSSASVLYVPQETRQELSVKDASGRAMYDWIDSVYDSKDPRPYMREIERLLGVQLSHYVKIDIGSLALLADLAAEPIYGDAGEVATPFKVLMEKPVALKDENGLLALFPQGSVALDGAKAVIYADYLDSSYPDPEANRAERRRILLNLVLKVLSEKASLLLMPDAMDMVYASLSTSFTRRGFTAFIENFKGYNIEAATDRYRSVAGRTRVIEGRKALDPSLFGEQVKSVVQQDLDAIKRGIGADERRLRIRILNGTTTRLLAQNAAALYGTHASYTIEVGNADTQDYEKTVVIQRGGTENDAIRLAEIIRCTNIRADASGGVQSESDIDIILGRDFNGKYCVE